MPHTPNYGRAAHGYGGFKNNSSPNPKQIKVDMIPINFKYMAIAQIMMCGSTFLIGCFVNASFDITQWTEDSRTAIGVAYSVITCLCWMVYAFHQNEVNNR